MRQHIQNVTMILLGALICAFGVNYFTIPNQLAEGGLTGVALILKYTFDLSPALTTLALNIPLFIIGWRELGRTSMVYTIIGTTAFSLFLWVTEDMAPQSTAICCSLPCTPECPLGLVWALSFALGERPEERTSS